MEDGRWKVKGFDYMDKASIQPLIAHVENMNTAPSQSPLQASASGNDQDHP